ncbi:MAG: glycosyltransferase [Bacillota bacterium]|nr:glycosyltransferase [Bacillota bacterium]
MIKTMIFHHPQPVYESGFSGSSVRPYQMIKAFKRIGYEVEEVAGSGARRKEAISKIKDELREGKKYCFIYSESSTMPSALTEKHHLPLYISLDNSFLGWANSHEIPIGLFYRDIYWMFDIYKKSIKFHKYYAALPFYYYDLICYSKCAQVIFLPSLTMKEALPTWFNSRTRFEELPPGTTAMFSSNKPSNMVKMIYVGGIKPPLYDLTPLFKLASTISDQQKFEINLVCREEEWEIFNNFYKPFLTPYIKILHKSGDNLASVYEDADIFVLLRGKHEYLRFVMPVKVFEAISYGKPIITNNHTEVARFVEREDIGWVVNSIDEAKELLLNILADPKMLEEKKQKVFKAAEKHTWINRAKKVADVLVK